MATETLLQSRSFALRRVHSLFGLWIVLFLIEHIVTNSQSALLIGESGQGFVRAVNFIKNLPYLHVIEIILLGIPLLYHMVLGLTYLRTAKMNSFPRSKQKPTVASSGRNHAYSWQRITSWVLLIGIIAHVSYMRFYMYPTVVERGKQSSYFVRISMDPGLYTVSDRLGVTLYDKEAIDAASQHVAREEKELARLFPPSLWEGKEAAAHMYNAQAPLFLQRYQKLKQDKAFVAGLKKRSLTAGEVIAASSNFGTATLLIVRNSFKSVLTSILYTLFVLAAAFHAFNGLWTFLITWGLMIKCRAQSLAARWCVCLMFIIGALGLASIWGTYYLNLRN